MLNLGLDTWSVSFYSEVPLLNKIRRIKLQIRDFEKIGDYKYSFKASLFKRKLILDNFKDCKIIKASPYDQWFGIKPFNQLIINGLHNNV